MPHGLTSPTGPSSAQLIAAIDLLIGRPTFFLDYEKPAAPQNPSLYSFRPPPLFSRMQQPAAATTMPSVEKKWHRLMVPRRPGQVL